MLTYEVKITIEASVEGEWLRWMKTKHLPDVIATGLIKSFQILKPREQDSTYLFHYHFGNPEDYEHYQEVHAPRLKAGPAQKYLGMFKAERRLLQWI